MRWRDLSSSPLSYSLAAPKTAATSALYAQCRILQLSWTPGHAWGPILGRKQYLPPNTASLPCLHAYATLPPSLARDPACWQRKPHYYPTSCVRLCVHAGALVYLVRSVTVRSEVRERTRTCEPCVFVCGGGVLVCMCVLCLSLNVYSQNASLFFRKKRSKKVSPLTYP